MQPTDIIGPNQILETSQPRRRQKVRVRAGLGKVKPSSAPALTTTTTTTNTNAINANSFASRRISVTRFKPRKEENVKFGEISSHSVAGRPRMRRPPSLRTGQRPQRARESQSPSPVMKSIKRMRIRARERKQQRTTPRSSSTSVRTSSTLGTTEVITINPDAHKIRFTLDSNEVTSELPIPPSGPSASRLVSTFLVPDDVFRQGVKFVIEREIKCYLAAKPPTL